MPTRFHRAGLLLVFATLFTLTTAQAQDIWLGGTGNWSDAAMWSTGIVPNGPTVDVRIDNGNPVASVVTFDLATGSVGDLILDSDDTLVINGTLTSYFATLTSGTLNISSGGSFNNGGLLNNYGELTNHDIFGGGTLNNAGTINNFGSGPLTIGLDNSGGSQLNNTGTINSFSGINNSDGTINNSGLFNQYSGIDNSVTGSVNNNSGGTFNSYGGIGGKFGNSINNSGMFSNWGMISGNELAQLTNTGTFNNWGTIFYLHSFITNTGIFNNYQAYSLADTPTYNSGTINNFGMLLFDNSPLSNDLQGVLNNYGTITSTGILPLGVIENIGTLNNCGVINFSFFTNAGEIEIAPGATLASNTSEPGTYTQSAGFAKIDGLFSSVMPIQINGGTLSGSGVIQGDVMMGGTLSPGDSPGKLIIIGNYTQFSTGTFFAELAGLTAGKQYDQLQVSSTATLDGTLDVVLLNGFVVHLGDRFVLMTFADEVGQFSTLDLSTLSAGEMWRLSYNATDLVLQAVPSSVPEPTSILLMAAGLVGTMRVLRRRMNA
jgi:hypothetical protein